MDLLSKVMTLIFLVERFFLMFSFYLLFWRLDMSGKGTSMYIKLGIGNTIHQHNNFSIVIHMVMVSDLHVG